MCADNGQVVVDVSTKKKTLTVLARLAAECPQEPKHHILYGRLLLCAQGDANEQSLQRGIQSLIRGMGQMKRDDTQKQSILETTLNASRLILESLPRLSDAATAKRFATSMRLNAQSVARWAGGSDEENNDEIVRKIISDLRDVGASAEIFSRT